MVLNDAAIDVARLCLDQIARGQALTPVPGFHDRLSRQDAPFLLLYELGHINTLGAPYQDENIRTMIRKTARHMLQTGTQGIALLGEALTKDARPLFAARDTYSKAVAGVVIAHYEAMGKAGTAMSDVYTENMQAIVRHAGLRLTRNWNLMQGFGRIFKGLIPD